MAPPGSPERPVTTRNWLALFGVMLGAFMAVLDIQITNSSLNDISGALGSSLDEGSWVSTAYLVAEIVIIGLSGALGGIIGLKRYILISSSGFLLFSILCAFSQNLAQMIFFRTFQGMTGGALIPLAFGAVLVLLPPAKRSIGMAMFGLTATFGPAIGPTIGGWLTNNYGWQWIFFINVVPGLVMLTLTWFCLPDFKSNFSLLDRFDYWGVLLMAIGLASLTYVLEEGERKDWFGNPLIVRGAWIAFICLTLFITRELTYEKPLINLRIFREPTFAVANAIQTCLGFGLYGSVYLLPLYLARVQHYNAQEIGLTMMWIGLPQLLLIPLVPRLMKIFDVRYLLGVGLLCFSGSCFMNSRLDPDFAGDQFFWGNLVRAMGQPLIFIPLLSIATSRTAPKDSGSASAVLNMMRNLGGSIGIAMLSTLVTQREDLHSVLVGEHVTPYRAQVDQRLDSLEARFAERGLPPGTAKRAAQKTLSNSIRTQAFIEAYGDAFFTVGAVMALSAVGILFLPKARLGAAAPAH